MAIIPWLPGVSISICSSENDLAEYPSNSASSNPPDPNDIAAVHVAGKTHVWFVECTEAEFSIKLKVNNYDLNCAKLGFEIYVDGKLAAMPHLPRPEYQKAGRSWNYEVLGLERKESTRKDTVKRFRFTEIETTCNATKMRIEREKKLLSFAGDIVVKLYRKSFGKILKPEKAIAKNGVPTHVSEVALKGKSVSHGTAYDEEEHIKKQKKYDTDYKDGKDRPIAVFHFKYRSKAALQQEMIIPRDRSPSPPAETESFEEAFTNCTPEKRAAIEKLLGISSRGRSKIVKREYEIEDDEGSNARRAKKSRVPVFIDLSNEDSEEDDE